MRGGRSCDEDMGDGGGSADRLIAEFDGVWWQVKGKLELVLIVPGIRERLMGFLDRINAGVGSNDEALAKVGRHIIRRVLELRK